MKSNLVIAGFFVGACLMGCSPIKKPLKLNTHSETLVLLSCGMLDSLKSERGDIPLTIDFRNFRDRPIKMYWVNYNGVEELSATIEARSTWRVDTYTTHPWVIRDARGKCIRAYNSIEKPSEIVLVR